MLKTIFMELLILAIVAVFVILSEILLKKRKSIKKCLVESLKTQVYYMMAYILGIIIPLVFHISNLTIHNITIIIILSLEVICFLRNFLTHLKKSPNKNSVAIMIIKIIMEKITLLLKCFCKKRIDTITES